MVLLVSTIPPPALKWLLWVSPPPKHTASSCSACVLHILSSNVLFFLQIPQHLGIWESVANWRKARNSDFTLHVPSRNSVSRTTSSINTYSIHSFGSMAPLEAVMPNVREAIRGQCSPSALMELQFLVVSQDNMVSGHAKHFTKIILSFTTALLLLSYGKTGWERWSNFSGSHRKSGAHLEFRPTRHPALNTRQILRQQPSASGSPKAIHV